MVTVWFFLAVFAQGAVQSGPFVSLEQCEQARAVWEKTRWTYVATPCYQGVVK